MQFFQIFFKISFDLVTLVITFIMIYEKGVYERAKKIRKTCFPVKDARKCKNKGFEYYFTSQKSSTAQYFSNGTVPSSFFLKTVSFKLCRTVDFDC